eukprot:15439714-Alexandrium_andersonii.AAC.1
MSARRQVSIQGVPARSCASPLAGASRLGAGMARVSWSSEQRPRARQVFPGSGRQQQVVL